MIIVYLCTWSGLSYKCNKMSVSCTHIVHIYVQPIHTHTIQSMLHLPMFYFNHSVNASLAHVLLRSVSQSFMFPSFKPRFHSYGAFRFPWVTQFIQSTIRFHELHNSFNPPLQFPWVTHIIQHVQSTIHVSMLSCACALTNVRPMGTTPAATLASLLASRRSDFFIFFCFSVSSLASRFAIHCFLWFSKPL